jgi:hypothetical protein
VRETEILVEQQPPKGVFICDHAGLVINEFSSVCALQRPDTSEAAQFDEIVSPTPPLRLLNGNFQSGTGVPAH